MEGTKNERSIVIVASYVIGFATGFILLNNYSNPESTGAVVYTAEDSYYTNSTSNKETTSPLPDYMQKTFALASEDDKFIFYCEKLDPSDNFCYGYVFDKSANTVYLLETNSTPFSIAEDIASVVRWENGKLVIGNITSVNATEPWLLVNSETIDLQ